MSNIWLPKPKPKEGALVYFTSASGAISIPMITDVPTPAGWQRHEVHSAKAIEDVSRRFAAQKQTMFDQADEKLIARLEAKMAEVRGKLHYTMQHTSSQFEKDFIRYALKKLEEDENKLRTRKYEMHLEMEAKESPLKPT
jgi:hypothetical protein